MPLVPTEFEHCRWFAIRESNHYRLFSKIRHWNTRRISLRTALRRAHERPVMAKHKEWIYVFGADIDPASFSIGEKELCWFSIDVERGNFSCERYREGELVRSVERAAWGEVSHEGRPGQKREPSLDPFDAEAVLDFAEAWYCDPRELLYGANRAWVFTSWQPTQETPRWVADWRWLFVSVAWLAVAGLLARACF